jgi:NAD(P)-dependent dehydrogenase (short-subunit alcohol dehydrogenase family)
MAAKDQHRIGSGFGFRSTAAEVVDGIDLTGKLAIVTGGYSGIGIETTKALVGAGAFVVVPAVMACPETRVGPGWEAQFATNHLGHFALVNRLWPALRPGARVVAVSSAGHRYSAIRWDDVMFTGGGYEKWTAYGQSKTANSLFAVHLDLLGRGTGVRAFSLHPGGIATPLQRHLSHEELVERGVIDEDGNQKLDWLKTPEQGAATQVWAATSPQLAGLGGVYLEDCDVAELRTSDEIGAPGVYPYAVDPDEAARLWTLSAELTGVNALT